MLRKTFRRKVYVTRLQLKLSSFYIDRWTNPIENTFENLNYFEMRAYVSVIRITNSTFNFYSFKSHVTFIQFQKVNLCDEAASLAIIVIKTDLLIVLVFLGPSKGKFQKDNQI